ncbi:MAG: sigma-70 family RNA polymerase sigma factor [Planctomycetes bacterium]|nr:sigma-70 family RNA polymerase sigma factor [Planctomycetota bacterium]
MRVRRGPLLQRLGDTLDDAHDLILDVLDYAPRFLVASRHQFRALVARMIENALVDKARRASRRRPPERLTEGLGSSTVLGLDPPVARDPAPSDAAAREEELEWLRLGIEFLGDQERRIVLRSRFDGATFQEIGAEEGLQPNAARMRCSRALLRLAGIVQRLQSGQLAALVDADRGR